MAVANGSSSASTVAKSSHVADQSLQPFLQSTFDPADYLNSTLPSLAVSNTRQEQSHRVPLVELSTRTQSLLSQLNAQIAQLSNALTQLTDDIIRGGSRLAYDVEILRGETVGLSETLQDTLKDDIAKFTTTVKDPEAEARTSDTDASAEPEYIQSLRTLTLVRSRLDTVIKTFDAAMQWPLAPSELQSSFINVSGPEVTPEESHSREEKGRDAAQKLRNEIQSLLQTSTSPEEGVAAATKRIEELKTLLDVWKGTAEEKTRERFVEGLSRTVEEEQKKIAKRAEGRRQGGTLGQTMDYRYGDSGRVTQDGGYGFMNNLKRFKGDVYPD
ncbi:hypothetical protein MBLNU457_4281t1 [Dothideomycetes sp. NU457]